VQIVRHDADVLMLQSGSGAEKSYGIHLIAAVVLTVAIVVAAVWLAVASEWWPRLDGLSAAAIVVALAVGILLLSYAICDSVPCFSGLAFDRHAREILCIRKTLLRTSREVFGFDRVRRVARERVSTKCGGYHFVYLELIDGRKIPVSQPGPGGCSESQLDEIATAVREMLGLPEPQAEAQPTIEGWAAHVMKLVLSCAAIGACLFLASATVELWQSRSWPQIEGVVESVQLGKKMTSGKHAHLADAIEITYRYRLGDTVYHGQRFNTENNWLKPEQVPLVRQQYTSGGRCLVSYNPRNPVRCFVQVDVQLSTIIATGLASLVLGLVGLSGAGYTLWQIARPKSAQTPSAFPSIGSPVAAGHSVGETFSPI